MKKNAEKRGKQRGRTPETNLSSHYKRVRMAGRGLENKKADVGCRTISAGARRVEKKGDTPPKFLSKQEKQREREREDESLLANWGQGKLWFKR